MNRSDLVKTIRKHNKLLDQKDLNNVVAMIFDEIGTSLANGKRVEIRKFGTFEPRLLPARTAINPKTGEYIRLPERTTVHFKSSARMFQAVNTDPAKRT